MIDSTNHPPSPVAYQVLLSLGDGAKHGYGVMQEVAERSEGRVHILPGTLYSTIKKMLAARWIEECKPPRGRAGDDERRRYYRVTSLGRTVASQETERLATLVRDARRKGFSGAR